MAQPGHVAAGAQPGQRWIETSRPLGGNIFNVGLTSITASRSTPALCAAARAGGESDYAVAASVHSRAAGRLRFDSPATCPARYRSAYRPCLGGRPTTGPLNL